MSRSRKRRRGKLDVPRVRPLKRDTSEATVSWLSGMRPVLRAVTIFCVLMGAFYAFEFTKVAKGDVRRAYLKLIARVSGGTLAVLGYDTTVDGVSVSSPRFSMKIVRGCDATDPAAAFVAAVLASPTSIWAKIPGIAIGTLALLTINLLRVVSLFFVGIYFPSAFKTIHHGIWQASFIVLAIACWAIWVQWATRERVRKTDDST